MNLDKSNPLMNLILQPRLRQVQSLAKKGHWTSPHRSSTEYELYILKDKTTSLVLGIQGVTAAAVFSRYACTVPSTADSDP